ncbi:insulin-like growth factor 2 mRNA-binding protein 3-B [Artemia franciscana]
MGSKLYMGNLPTGADEKAIRDLLEENNFTCSSVLIKRGGYAFVELNDANAVKQAADKLNGYNFLGSVLVVEPSIASASVRRERKSVVVSNVPNHCRAEGIERLIPQGVNILRIERTDPPSDFREGTIAFEVTFESQDEAQEAVQKLNGVEFEGNNLKVEMMERRGSGRGRGGRNGQQGLSYLQGGPGTSKQPDFPLRILVLSDMVGAIIGRQGGTIRQITQQTRARVDVHRKENIGSLEKAITIYGNPENCTNACKKILEVMQQEAESTGKGEITLKMLAHNNLIGRIIGKGGATIKKIMQDTDTKITVSSINDISSYNLERIISIKGTIENMSKAEAIISEKLRQSYESDLQSMAPQSMFPGLHPIAMMSTAGMGFPRGAAPPSLMGSVPPYSGLYPPPITMTPQPLEETTYLYIPNIAVGAIIGTKGSHIRNIIRFSGASVKIATSEGQGAASHQEERKVTIFGTAESQWKAQYLIFEKMREEGFAQGDEVRLTVEILVPATQVGRIIGKGGQNVRELQRATSSIIKLPEQGASSGDEVTVHIIGTFYAVQSAQRRIRAMVSQVPGGRPPRGGPLREKRDQ